MRDHLVVGIAGGSGSGKTTFCNRLTESVGADAVVTLHHDCYYHDLSHQSQEERYANNYDAPEALQTDLLVEHVHPLISGDSVVMPQYDYSTNSRLPGGFPLDPRPIIIIEGVLVLADETIRDICDLRIFVDTSDELRLERRCRRDSQERGRDVETIRRQWAETVLPMHQRYVEPSKRWAHLVVPAEAPNETAVGIVGGYLLAQLNVNRA